ncbi:thioesterase II family protein [Plantactinospora sp. GCM10030261]|uniref:thioesterase II family protein n=1 Tax=Plantactinospora sp. GCM10030261 TaxID=3273420 RepID=UPI003612C00D
MVNEDALRWLRCPAPVPGAAVRLVCLPHAGGGASAFRRWPASLPGDVELHAVQYPGHEDRLDEPCVADFDRLADLITAAVAGLRDRPLALLGHSMGAALAHAVAGRLHRHGTAPLLHLFVSGAPAPRHHRPGTVHLRDDAGLVSEVRRLGGDPHRLLDNTELRTLVLPAIRADYRAQETRRVGWTPRLRCPVTALTGRDDSEAPAGQVADWAGYTDGPFRLRTYPGGHFYLDDHHETVVADVVADLGAPAWPDTP